MQALLNGCGWIIVLKELFENPGRKIFVLILAAKYAGIPFRFEVPAPARHDVFLKIDDD